MATVTSSQIVNTIEIAIANASLNALASTGYALGTAIDNRPTTGTVVAYDLADITITLSSAVVAVAPAYLTIWVLPAVDGTNYPSPPGGSAGAAPISMSYNYQFVAASTTTLICQNIPIPPYLYKVMIQNNLGVAFPATNLSNCLQVRKTIAGW